MDDEKNSDNPWALDKTPISSCCTSDDAPENSQLFFWNDESDEVENQPNTQQYQNKVNIYFKRWKRFFQIPRVKFFYDSVKQ